MIPAAVGRKAAPLVEAGEMGLVVHVLPVRAALGSTAMRATAITRG
ncbi:hypothetical protein SNARM312S_03648 [Streptomyces narbonensis]